VSKRKSVTYGIGKLADGVWDFEWEPFVGTLQEARRVLRTAYEDDYYFAVIKHTHEVVERGRDKDALG